MPNRECGTCTKCCEGWLDAIINNVPMYPGRPCYLADVGKGCKDYDNRPNDPCKQFNCQWVLTPEMPEHFKPEVSGVIISDQNIGGIPFFKATRAPEELSLEMLSWLVTTCRALDVNLSWDVKNTTYWVGSREFHQKMALAHPLTSPKK